MVVLCWKEGILDHDDYDAKEYNETHDDSSFEGIVFVLADTVRGDTWMDLLKFDSLDSLHGVRDTDLV